MDEDDRTKRGGGEGEVDAVNPFDEVVADRATEGVTGGEVGFRGDGVNALERACRRPSASGTSSSTLS